MDVFGGANPYAYEQETVANDAPRAAIASAVDAMSERLLADVAAEANMPDKSDKQSDTTEQAGRS
jgi:hypothetical protein